MKLYKKLDQYLEEWILGSLLVGMAVILLMQILMRTFFGNSLTWAEEVARYFYVWSVFLSVGYTIRTRSILRVDLVLSLMPVVVQKILNLVLEVLQSVLFAYLFYYSISVVKNVQISGQTSPALEIPMYLVYAIIPVGFALASLRSIQKIYFDLTGKDIERPIDPAESL